MSQADPVDRVRIAKSNTSLPANMGASDANHHPISSLRHELPDLRYLRATGV